MRIFITGVSSGIGRELTKLLIKDGHEVWGIARRQELLESLKSELSSDKFSYSVCDVSSEEEIQKLSAEINKVGDLPDIVVLNSAVLNRDLKNGFDFPALKEAFGVNFFGALSWVEKFLPKFLERGSGKFVAISSTSAFRPDSQSASLPASKAALSMAFRSLALRYKPQGIKFTNIYLGPVATDIIPEYTTPEGGKKYFFVLSAPEAAHQINQAIWGHKNTYYIPFGITLLFRLSLLLPDLLFMKISNYLKKKKG